MKIVNKNKFIFALSMLYPTCQNQKIIYSRRSGLVFLFVCCCLFYTAHCCIVYKSTDAGDCYREDDKSSYTGTINVTRSGRTCQLWESQTPHTHTRGSDPSAFVDGRFPDNFCRTPEDGISVKPWCYTTDADKRWQHCDVPSCGEDYEQHWKVIKQAQRRATGDRSGRKYSEKYVIL